MFYLISLGQEMKEGGSRQRKQKEKRQSHKVAKKAAIRSWHTQATRRDGKLSEPCEGLTPINS